MGDLVNANLAVTNLADRPHRPSSAPIPGVFWGTRQWEPGCDSPGKPPPNPFADARPLQCFSCRDRNGYAGRRIPDGGGSGLESRSVPWRGRFPGRRLPGVIRATQPAAATDVSACCRDLDNWPRSWMGLEKDLPPGERLLACFRPFIEHLAASRLSPKTIRQPCGQPLDAGRRDDPRPARRPFSEKNRRRPASPRCDSCRRRPAHPQWVRRRATLLRLNLPQAPPLPRSTPALSTPVTHKFPRTSLFKTPKVATVPSRSRLGIAFPAATVREWL